MNINSKMILELHKMRNDEIRSELEEEIAKGKGCIVFDFSCIFPYADEYDLIFKFGIDKIDTDNLAPYYLDHRSTNKDNVTISKMIGKNGKESSRLGYPLFVDLDKEYSFQLCVEIGERVEHWKREYISLRRVFPVRVKLTHDKPVCGLTLTTDIRDKSFLFGSWYKCDGEMLKWGRTFWENHESNSKGVIVMDEPTYGPYGNEDLPYAAFYHKELTPYPQALEDLYLPRINTGYIGDNLIIRKEQM